MISDKETTCETAVFAMGVVEEVKNEVTRSVRVFLWRKLWDRSYLLLAIKTAKI
jgi:hypothetical protein